MGTVGTANAISWEGASVEERSNKENVERGGGGGGGIDVPALDEVTLLGSWDAAGVADA